MASADSSHVAAATTATSAATTASISARAGTGASTPPAADEREFYVPLDFSLHHEAAELQDETREAMYGLGRFWL